VRGQEPAGWGQLSAFAFQVLRRMGRSGIARYLGEALRQASLLITGSVTVILMLVFMLGLQCGIEGAYAASGIGAANLAGAITALCDLREITPYAFGYMMAAKVATGYAAELGAMRISEEVDAIEVMGIDSLGFLCSSRLLATWLVLPFVYAAAIAGAYAGSYIAVVEQVAQVPGPDYLTVFWQFQSPPDLLFSFAKAMAMATFVVIVGCYFGYHASGGPVGVGRATARSMAVNIVGIHAIGIVGTQLFWGINPRSPVGG
jgi:phospholipid/cholesterol/gamma-HCH transport system permease protein